MVAKLCQIIAVESGTKSQITAKISEILKQVKKPDLFNGFFKKYEPLNEEGEKLPPEQKRVQLNVKGVLDQAAVHWSEWIDITARKDWTNCEAKAAVILNGREIIPSAPVSFLIFMEKRLTDIRTLVGELPTLDGAEDWKPDTSDKHVSNTEPVNTHRTKKVQKGITLIAPTVEHPGQAQLITEDQLVGHWVQIKRSGAIRKTEQDQMLSRIDKLLDAVKMAREEANMRDEVPTPKIGEAVFGFILGT